MSEEIDPDLNEEDILMGNSREYNWREVVEEVDDKKNIHALRWEV